MYVSAVWRKKEPILLYYYGLFYYITTDQLLFFLGLVVKSVCGCSTELVAVGHLNLCHSQTRFFYCGVEKNFLVFSNITTDLF